MDTTAKNYCYLEKNVTRKQLLKKFKKKSQDCQYNKKSKKCISCKKKKEIADTIMSHIMKDPIYAISEKDKKILYNYEQKCIKCRQKINKTKKCNIDESFQFLKSFVKVGKC